MRLGAAIACTVLAIAGSAHADQPSFDYLHVEANEGSSSGGHVAIRFGDDVYHFQHHGGGLLRLHREQAAAFLHHYARLENRPVHVRRVALDADALERLRRGFADRFLLEDAQHAQLDALREDVRVLDELADGATPVLQVPGARFFAPDGTCASGGTAAMGATGDVARRIGERRPGLLAERRAETLSALRDLAWTPDDTPRSAPSAELDPHRLVAAQPSLAARTVELLAAAHALDVLCTGAPLRRDALRDGPGELLRLGDGERAALAALARDLRERAIALAASRRPDWGSALLLALARLAAVEESLARGRIVVLDAYRTDAPTLSPDEVRAQSAIVPALLRESGAQLADARRPLARGVAPRELEYSALEAAVNRYLELSHASLGDAPLRLEPGTLVVGGEAPVPLPWAALPADRDALRSARDVAQGRVAAYRDALRARYGYDLLTRNCVSELFREIARALEPMHVRAHGDGAPDEAQLDCDGSTIALGGCVDPAERLRFIPFVSAAAVDREYRVVEREELPSYRGAALAQMRTDEGGLLVALREANVVSSTLYRARDEDSVFLFFTDEQPALRPLLGAANLATGVGATLAGIALLPADGGTLLARGLRGTLFSVPELGFVTIRKGTFAWAPRDGDAIP